MNTLIGYNSPDQVIQSLYNLSVFQSYQPGFNTIITDTSTTTILDISNIEYANPGYNVLIKEPEINFSVATVGGIDNSGAILRIGLNASSIIIGQQDRDINVNGKLNASTDISYSNMSNTGSLPCYSTRIYHTDTSGISLIPGLWTIMSTGNISINTENNSTLHWGITDNNFTDGDIFSGQQYRNIAANTTHINANTKLYSNTLTAILRVNNTKQIYSSVYLEGSSNIPYKLSNINSSFIAHRIC